MTHPNATTTHPTRRTPRGLATALITGAGALALITGAAVAQDTTGRAPTAPPALISVQENPSDSNWKPVEAGEKLGMATTFGTGPRAMVLIPDSAHTGETFERTFERYGEQATMYALTLRGNGGTEPFPGDPGDWFENQWTIASAEGVAEFLQKHDLNDVVLVGHGNGAQVAWRAAKIDPDRVAGIISLDGYAWHPVDAASGLTRREMVRGLEDRMSRTNDENHERLRSTIVGAMVQAPDDANFLIEDHLRTPRVVHRRYMLEAQNAEIKDDMIALAKPALVIAALPDNARGVRVDVMRERFEEVYGEVPGAFVEYFEDSRHFVMFDSPDLLEIAIVEFIGTLPAPGADETSPDDSDSDDAETP
ncbi:MAG: alpha/beta fold hydrolase [Phycisphaerales bacterium]